MIDFSQSLFPTEDTMAVDDQQELKEEQEALEEVAGEDLI